MNCLCLSQSQIATTLAIFWALASDCRGLLVAQALLQLTAKLAQQANSLSFVKMLWLTLLHKLDNTTESWPDFTDKTALLRPACLWVLLAAQQQNFPPADNRFLSQRKVRVKALQLALRTFSAALVPPTYAFDGVLGLAGRTASQIELSSHTNCSAKQGLLLDTTTVCFRVCIGGLITCQGTTHGGMITQRITAHVLRQIVSRSITSKHRVLTECRPLCRLHKQHEDAFNRCQIRLYNLSATNTSCLMLFICLLLASCSMCSARPHHFVDECGEKTIAILEIANSYPSGDIPLCDVTQNIRVRHKILSLVFCPHLLGVPEFFLQVAPVDGIVYRSPGDSNPIAHATHGTHAAPWYLAQAIRASGHYTADIEAADLVFVDDYCLYLQWLAHVHTFGGQKPSTFGSALYIAYSNMVASPRWQSKNGADFVFYDSHPGFRSGWAADNIMHLICDTFGGAWRYGSCLGQCQTEMGCFLPRSRDDWSWHSRLNRSQRS